MPLITDIQPDKRLVIHKGTGELTFADFATAATNLFSHPDFQSDFSIILDLLEATMKTLSAADVVKLAEMLENMGSKRGCGISIIVATEDLEYGLSRMMQSYLADQKRIIEIVRDLETAYERINQSKIIYGNF